MYIGYTCDSTIICIMNMVVFSASIHKVHWCFENENIGPA
jgi:hypothetical protein